MGEFNWGKGSFKGFLPIGSSKEVIFAFSPIIICTGREWCGVRIHLLINYDYKTGILQMATLKIALPSPPKYSTLSADILVSIKEWFKRGLSWMRGVSNGGMDDEFVEINFPEAGRTMLFRVPIYREGVLKVSDIKEQGNIYKDLINYIVSELRVSLLIRGLYWKMIYRVQGLRKDADIARKIIMKEINKTKRDHGKVIYFTPDIDIIVAST